MIDLLNRIGFRQIAFGGEGGGGGGGGGNNDNGRWIPTRMPTFTTIMATRQSILAQTMNNNDDYGYDPYEDAEPLRR
jgi:hypothetical protein